MSVQVSIDELDSPPNQSRFAALRDTALDGLPAHIAVVDREGVVVLANQHWREFGRKNGNTDPNDSIGINYLAVCRAATGECAKDAFETAQGIEDVLESRRDSFRIEYPCHSPTEKRWFECLVSPGYLDGEPTAIVMHTDVTERHLAMEAAAKAHDAAEALALAKTRFLANMSHEIRTPLNAIIGFAEVMDEQVFGPVGDKRYQEYVGAIRSSAAHLMGLLTDVMENAKADHRDINAEKALVDVSDVFDLATQLSRGPLGVRGIRLTKLIAPDAGTVSGDARLLTQIVVNLVSNAGKVSPPGSIVHLTSSKKSDGETIIAVKDSGPGIPEADRDRVFQPFETLSDRSETYERGAGLGLSIVQQLVHALGGRIEILAPAEGGTEIRVTLPTEP